MTIPHWSIAPLIGLGPLRLGASREEVLRILGPQSRCIGKGASTVLTDVFGDSCVYVFYDDQANVRFIEVFEGIDVSFQGVSLLGYPAHNVLAALSANGYGGEDRDGSIVFPNAGFVLSLAGIEVKAVGVFCAEYYEAG